MDQHREAFSSMSSRDRTEEIEQAPPYTETDVAPAAHDHAARQAEQSRMSTYSYADLPEVVPGHTYSTPQVVPSSAYSTYPEALKTDHDSESHKYAVPSNVLPQAYDEEGGKEVVPPLVEPPAVDTPSPRQERLNRKIFGVRVKWAILALVIVVILAIALGAGLGAGLHKSSPSFDTTGVYNQSRVSLAYQRQEQDNDTTLVMYFQHENTHLRTLERADDGVWVGGGTEDDFVSNPAQLTPLSVVSYQWNYVSWWRVFFIDGNYDVQSIWNSSATTGWATGLLGSAANTANGPIPKAFNGQKIGMVACWDSPNSWNESGLPFVYDPNDILIRVVYAINQTSFQELSYNHATLTWTVLGVFNNLNGQVSPTCYNPRPGTSDYMIFADANNDLVVYWKDNSTATTNTTSQWTQTSVSIPNIDDAGELAFTNGAVFAQSSTDNMIHGYTINFDGNNTSVDSSTEFVVQGPPAVSGSGLGAISEADGSGVDVIVVYQPEGTTDLREFRQSGGNWTAVNLPVPDS